MSSEGPIPSDAHRAFAEAIVKLAREHKMNGLSFSFRSSFALLHGQDSYSGTVRGSWSEGRHGKRSRIMLQFDGTTSFDEISHTGETDDA